MTSDSVTEELERTSVQKNSWFSSRANPSRSAITSLTCCCTRKRRNGVKVNSGLGTWVSRGATTQNVRRVHWEACWCSSDRRMAVRHGARRGLDEKVAAERISSGKDLASVMMPRTSCSRNASMLLSVCCAAFDWRYFRHVIMDQPSMWEIRSRCCTERRLIRSVDEGSGFPVPLVVRISK